MPTGHSAFSESFRTLERGTPAAAPIPVRPYVPSLLVALFTATGCAAGTRTATSPTTAATTEFAPRRALPKNQVQLSLGGEPWNAGVSIKAVATDSPAHDTWDAWASPKGSRLVTLEIVRPDGRTFALQLVVGPEKTSSGRAKAVASYRTTKDDLWSATGAVSARITRDERGRIVLVSADFELALGKRGEARPLRVTGSVEDVAVDDLRTVP